MPIRIIEVAPKDAWHCAVDPSFRLGEPDPETAIKALARAVVVTVEENDTGYVTWTEPENRYHVAHGTGQPGFCKHIVACILYENPILRQCALGALDWMERIEQLEKENKKLRKENEKWRKKESMR